MSDIFVVSNLEALKAMADPLRARLLESLISVTRNGKQLSIKQLSEKVQVPPGKLYYHINLLEKNRLITISETKLTGNILEKYYQSSASQYHLDPGLISADDEDSSGQDSLITLVSNILDQTKQEIRHSIQKFLNKNLKKVNRKTFSLSRAMIELRMDQFDAFTTKLKALIAEFETDSSKPSREDSMVLRMTTAIYPIAISEDNTENAYEE